MADWQGEGAYDSTDQTHQPVPITETDSHGIAGQRASNPLPTSPPQPDGAGPWGRPPRPIGHLGLHPAERWCDARLLAADHLTWLGPRNALASRRWSECWVAARVVECLGHHIMPLPPHLFRTFLTPRGIIRGTRAVPMWLDLPGLLVSPLLLRFWVLEHETHGYLGVSLIIGRAFLDYTGITVHEGIAGGEERSQSYVPLQVGYGADDPSTPTADNLATTDRVNGWLHQNFPSEE